MNQLVKKIRLKAKISQEEFAKEIHETVKQMFREVKTSDEEVTSFLSGGVDSSYVLAMSDALGSGVRAGYSTDSRATRFLGAGVVVVS